MWISVILSMLRSIRRNHRAVETPVHGAFDERPFLSARDGPHPSPTAFQNGRFFPQCPGIVTATHVGDRIRSIDVCFFFLMAPQDLTEDGLQRGLCDFYCIWDLYQQYLVNEQQMLNRRTALLVNYENANRNWDKAKAHKKDEVKKSFIILLDAIHAISRTPISCVVCRFFDCTIPSVRSPSQRHFP